VLWFPPVFAALVWGLYYVSPSAYLFLLKEYMVVEDLQFLFYLAAAVLAALVAHRLWTAGTRQGGLHAVSTQLGILYGIGAVGLFFVAGEEVSWGDELWERILPFYPDKAQLRALGNKQGETTLHNMGNVNHIFMYFLFAIAVYAVLSAVARMVLERRKGAVPGWVDYLVFPRITVPAMLIASTFFVVAIIVLPPHQTNPGPGEVAFRRYQEVAELYISASLLLLTWLRLRATPRAESEDGMWSRRRLRARQTSAQR
jgi:hypothetical protein